MSGSLLLGDKTATQGDMYAMKGGEKKVFLVPAFQETSFTKKPFDLRDKKILKFDRDKADTLTLVRGADSWTWRARAANGKSSSRWPAATTARLRA